MENRKIMRMAKINEKEKKHKEIKKFNILEESLFRYKNLKGIDKIKKIANRALDGIEHITIMSSYDYTIIEKEGDEEVLEITIDPKINKANLKEGIFKGYYEFEISDFGLAIKKEEPIDETDFIIIKEEPYILKIEGEILEPKKEDLGEIFSVFIYLCGTYEEEDPRIDLLTEVYSRNMLKQTKKRMNKKIKDGNTIGVIFIDLNNLKKTNDQKGHSYGDELLRKTGKTILRNILKSRDIAIRIGGDEFVIFLEGTNKESIKIIAKRIAKNLEENEISASIGIAIADEDIDRSIKEADLAMYKAKNNNKDEGCTIFEYIDEDNIIEI